MSSESSINENSEKTDNVPILRGLACPKCGCRHLDVVYTRARPGCIVRLRECRYCGRRIPTREQA